MSQPGTGTRCASTPSISDRDPVSIAKRPGAPAPGLPREYRRAKRCGRFRQDAAIAIDQLSQMAHALQGYRERCLAAGMDGYLAKPIVPEELDRVLHEVAGASGDAP
jgi:hypothetical protein